jgi:hypothetical protein
MQRKDLALRVLSTAAIMSIVTSIAAPAFADIYYIGNGSIDVETKEDTDGKYVQVTQNGTTYTDRSNEIVIKDGTSEKDATLKEADRDKDTQAKPAVAPADTAATLELEATGSADAAGESQPDPDDAFTLSEEEEDSEEGKDPTDNPTANPTDDPTANPTDDPTANPKKDVVYEYAPADPDSEQQATKLAPTTSADPTAKTNEATLADPSATTNTPAEGSAKNPSKNVIKVINNWWGDAAKELKIRLSNVNIKPDGTVAYQAAMDVSGSGKTKIELDGQNALDSSGSERAGLHKQIPGKLIITDETDDRGNKITAPKLDDSGSLTAKGGRTNGSAGIGGNTGESTGNIIIEGYATVDATGGGSAAGIGGGGSDNGFSGSAYNITIQGHSKVTASAYDGAAIGSGSAFGGDYGGSAKGIVIRDHATVVAKSTGVYGASGYGAAIGAAGYGGDNTEAEVTIGTAGATAEEEDVNIIATGFYGSAIGNGAKDTKVTIQGHATVQTASSQNDAAIGSDSGNVEVTIKDNVSIDNEDTVTHPTHPLWVSSGIGGGYIARNSGRTVKVTIDGGENGQIEIGKKSAITGNYGAISGTEVTIKDHVLLKMKQRDPYVEQYILVNDAEAEVGTRSNTPGASGLVNTIGDNTELWYTNYYNKLQKIVHGKNICKKGSTQDITKQPTCTEPGSANYTCNYEHGAAHPSCNRTWTDEVSALGHDYQKTSTVAPTCGAQGYDVYTCTHDSSHTEKRNYTPALGHNFHGTETVTKAPTCTTEGTKTVKCTRCDAVDTQTIPKDPDAHDWGEWKVTTPATCTTPGVETRYCNRDHNHSETRPTAKDSNNHAGHGTHIEGYVAPTCTKDGYTGDTYCNGCKQKIKDGTVIPATGHHWVDKGDGTHTCTKCGATEGQPSNTNSALELRVVDAEGMDQPFTVSQNGTLRTYTGAYDIATLTGDLDTLRYLQDHGAQTIQFVTNGQTSSFDINDLLAQGSGSEVFYLTHRGAEEPTLLLVEADHSELVKD